jgi:hypothetical protein
MDEILDVLWNYEVDAGPDGERVVSAAVQLAKLNLAGGSLGEIDKAELVLRQLNARVEVPRLMQFPKSPRAPIDHEASLVYLAAASIRKHQLKPSQKTQRVPLFKKEEHSEVHEPLNFSAEFLVAFAHEVSPSITRARCHSAHDRLKRTDEGKFRKYLGSLTAAQHCAFWKRYQDKLDSDPELLAEIEAAMMSEHLRR